MLSYNPNSLLRMNFKLVYRDYYNRRQRASANLPEKGGPPSTQYTKNKKIHNTNVQATDTFFRLGETNSVSNVSGLVAVVEEVSTEYINFCL